MAGTAPSWPTFNDYTFDLQSRLRQAARSSLAEFEASINRDGYGWLNDYIDNIEAQGRRAPIADLIKTPSRTATAKKTRAMSAAKQSRAEQVQKFNLALSPFVKSPEGRQPFSPLRVQPLNSMPLSPTRSPLQARTALLMPKSPVKEKTPVKPKRGRPKKVKENHQSNDSKENDNPAMAASPAPKGKSTRGAASKASAKAKAAAKSAASPVKTVEAADESVMEISSMPVKEAEDQPTEEILPEEDESRQPDPEEAVESGMALDDDMVDIPLEVVGEAPLAGDEVPEDIEEAEEEVEEEEEVDEEIEEVVELEDAPGSEAPAIEEPAKPSGPIRQVRSSWLTQALGTNTVPLSSADHKSTSASRRVSQQVDALRQGNAATGTFKRKSDEALDDQEEPKRADKMARFDAVATDASSGRPLSPRRVSGAAAGRLQGSKSLSAPGVSTPTSSFTTKPAASAPGDFESRIAALRERTAPPPGQKPVAPPANSSGFLGRLGNLVGLSAHEQEAASTKGDADRAAQANAEAELQRVLRELAEAETKKKEAERATEEAIRAHEAIQSRSNSPSSRTLSTQPGDVAIVVDEAAEDMEVDDSIDLPSLPELSPTSFFNDHGDDSMADHGSALGTAGIHLDDSMMFAATSTPVRKAKHPESRPGSAMSSSQQSILSQAERMAGKMMGVRATPGTVKSLAVAEAAAKREQAEAQRRAQLRVQIEQKKQEEKQKALDAERAKDEEERRKRKEEEEERRRRLAKAEKARKEKMERFNKQNAAREQREAEARAKEEAEAARKRKAAQGLTKSQSSSTLTKSTASSLNKSTSTVKRVAPTASAKEPLQANKSFTAAPSAGPSKLGPNVFRTAPEQPRAAQTQTPVKEPVVRPTLGPPVRTSTVAAAASTSRASTAQAAGPSRTSAVAGSVLQQSRVTLQAQLAQKALEQAAEDIVLPDIASEYSDSDDEEKESDFKRPAWAESPELKQLLEMQQHVNPDELFGPIRPLSMEDLFQARNGKFRARTSSANWSGQDRLTEAEERDYARRMGFRPINAPRDGGEN